MSNNPSTDPDSDYLPGNLPECHKMITDLRHEVKRLLELAETVKLLQQRISELESQVRRHNRARSGKSSAKVPALSLTGTGQAYYNDSHDELENQKAQLGIADEKKVHGGGGRSATKSAPNDRTIKHELTHPTTLLCPCCGELRQVIGFKTSYQLDIIKSAFELLKHVQLNYACPKCKSEVVTAPKPESLIDKGAATEGLVAHIGVSKFDWHLPLYRQERIYRAQSVSISRSSMSRWLKEAADMMRILVKRMHELILQSRVIQSDDTSMPVIKKGLGKAHRGFTWIYLGDEDFPYNIFDFTESHEGAHPRRVLNGFKGTLQTDGAAVYNGVIEDGATRAGCLSHLFRYFEDARLEDRERADHALGILKSLFDIEKVAAELSEHDRKDLRERLSKPNLSDLKAWLDATADDVLPKSDLGRAVNYGLNQWQAICHYAETGFVQAHNNNSENALRPAVLGRDNWLFCGSVEGGHTAAIWMSVVQTCRRHKIDPFEYIKDVLTRLPGTPTSQIDQFLPDRWKALQAPAQ